MLLPKWLHIKKESIFHHTLKQIDNKKKEKKEKAKIRNCQKKVEEEIKKMEEKGKRCYWEDQG